MAYDLLIKNGWVVDGSGRPRYRADVGVSGGRIAAIGRIRESAREVLDDEGAAAVVAKAERIAESLQLGMFFKLQPRGAAAGDDEDEEGLVHFACARRGSDKVAHREEHFGAIGRDGVRIAALNVALELLEGAMR